jgi:hypothetical protein
MNDNQTPITNDQAAQRIMDGIETAFIAGFEAGQSNKSDNWRTKFTEWLTKGIG